MKIGLIFPNADRRYKTVHLGLGYLAAYARKMHDDLEFKVLDTRVATRKETNTFYDTAFDMVGITVFAPVYKEVIAVYDRVKSKRNVPVCLGGPYVTTIMKEVFQGVPAEYAVYGEGEITFSELIHHLKGQWNINDINGLIYRTSTGKVITNPPREQIRDLDTLPFPAYDLFPMNRYPLHRVVSSRGCVYSCSFCNSSSIWSATWRKRSPQRVIEEIEFLVKNFGKKIFILGDNTFNVDAKRAEEFCDLLIREKTGILWSASIRADQITAQLAGKMKDSGCYNVAIGIESANNQVLERMNKKTTIEAITAGIKELKKAGIEILGQFVIGSPSDTLETVKESLVYAKNSKLDFINFYTVLPFKGTPQWSYIERSGHFYHTTIHEFPGIKPRIVFDTPEFPYHDRLTAIQLADKEGYYNNSDRKNWWFDFAKECSRKLQAFLPASIGTRIFMLMKAVYRMRIIRNRRR